MPGLNLVVVLFQPRVIELLYQHGADLTSRTKSGETPFGECRVSVGGRHLCDVSTEIIANMAPGCCGTRISLGSTLS